MAEEVLPTSSFTEEELIKGGAGVFGSGRFGSARFGTPEETWDEETRAAEGFTN